MSRCSSDGHARIRERSTKVGPRKNAVKQAFDSNLLFDSNASFGLPHAYTFQPGIICVICVQQPVGSWRWISSAFSPRDSFSRDRRDRGLTNLLALAHDRG